MLINSDEIPDITKTKEDEHHTVHGSSKEVCFPDTQDAIGGTIEHTKRAKHRENLSWDFFFFYFSDVNEVFDAIGNGRSGDEYPIYIGTEIFIKDHMETINCKRDQEDDNNKTLSNVPKAFFCTDHREKPFKSKCIGNQDTKHHKNWENTW